MTATRDHDRTIARNGRAMTEYPDDAIEGDTIVQLDDPAGGCRTLGQLEIRLLRLLRLAVQTRMLASEAGASGLPSLCQELTRAAERTDIAVGLVRDELRSGAPRSC